MDTTPTFISIEPSSFVEPAFPVEVFWTTSEDDFDGYMVNPEGVERWAGWDFDYLQLHLTTREEVKQYGKPPSFMCQVMSAHLTGKTLYSERPAEEGRWLRELFSVGGAWPPPFSVSSSDELLLDILNAKVSDSTRARSLLDEAKAEARDEVHGIRGGAWEMLYFGELWRRLKR